MTATSSAPPPRGDRRAYRQDSDLRKPKPGMILQADAQLALDLARAGGRGPADVYAGKAAGPAILVKNGSLPTPARRNRLVARRSWWNRARKQEVIRAPAPTTNRPQATPDWSRGPPGMPRDTPNRHVGCRRRHGYPDTRGASSRSRPRRATRARDPIAQAAISSSSNSEGYDDDAAHPGIAQVAS